MVLNRADWNNRYVNASVLGIDVNFNLGLLYVKTCTYQNFKIITEHGKYPIMVGPALVHSSKHNQT